MVEYTQKINKCAEIKDVIRAEELFGMMKRQGVQPNEVTYNVLMKAYSKAGKANRVFEVFDEMIREGIEPNELIFNTAINACAINCDIDRDRKSVV